jgi:hypothetical protein
MSNGHTGKLVLQEVPTGEVEKKVVLLLSKFAKSISHEKLTAKVRNTPYFLSNDIPAEKALILMEALQKLGATVAFVPHAPLQPPAEQITVMEPEPRLRRVRKKNLFPLNRSPEKTVPGGCGSFSLQFYFCYHWAISPSCFGQFWEIKFSNWDPISSNFSRTYLKNAVIEDEDEYEVMQRSSSSSLFNAQWLSALSCLPVNRIRHFSFLNEPNSPEKD